jgi:signal transduction histidine kinase
LQHTGYATIATAIDAMKACAYDFLPKPFTPDELRLIVKRGCERWQLAHESQRLRQEKEAAERRIITFVSHQLKSPLAATRQYLDVLLFTSKADLPPTALQWIPAHRPGWRNAGHDDDGCPREARARELGRAGRQHQPL